MTSDYKPDRYRDRLMAAENAANVAARVWAALIEQGLVGPDEFKEVLLTTTQKAVYEATMGLAGEDTFLDPPKAPTGNVTSEAAQGPRDGFHHQHDVSGFGDKRLPFGKFKGMTLDQAYNATGPDGKTGKSWLEWASTGLDKPDLRNVIAAYLEAKK